jgi:hypothetical protein
MEDSTLGSDVRGFPQRLLVGCGSCGSTAIVVAFSVNCDFAPVSIGRRFAARDVAAASQTGFDPVTRAGVCGRVPTRPLPARLLLYLVAVGSDGQVPVDHMEVLAARGQASRRSRASPEPRELRGVKRRPRRANPNAPYPTP